MKTRSIIHIMLFLSYGFILMLQANPKDCILAFYSQIKCIHNGDLK